MSRGDKPGCGCMACEMQALKDRVAELKRRIDRLEDDKLGPRLAALGYVSAIRPWMAEREALEGAVSIVERVHGGEVSLAEEPE